MDSIFNWNYGFIFSRRNQLSGRKSPKIYGNIFCGKNNQYIANRIQYLQIFFSREMTKYVHKVMTKVHIILEKCFSFLANKGG